MRTTAQEVLHAVGEAAGIAGLMLASNPTATRAQIAEASPGRASTSTRCRVCPCLHVEQPELTGARRTSPGASRMLRAFCS
jgi:hypothetical protein